MAVEKYYNEDKTKIGVLVSEGYGAGWSTWYDPEPDTVQKRFNLAIDKRIIEWWKNHPIPDPGPVPRVKRSGERTEGQKKLDEFYDDLGNFLKSIGYTGVYLGGYEDLKLQWVEVGRRFRITEYDGSEYLLFLDEIEFVEA